MLQFYAGPFVDVLGQIGKLGQVMEIMPGSAITLTRADFAKIHADVRDFQQTCTTLGFVMCAASASRLVPILDRVATILDQDVNAHSVNIGPVELIPMRGYMNEITNRVKDELGTRLLLIVPDQNAAQYEQLVPLFGEEFANKFSHAQYDLAEAGKCLSLGRSTAAVFHLTRVVEVGLGAAHSCLGIAVPLVGADRNWGNILNRIRDDISRRGPKWSEKDYFQEVYVLLSAVKDAWRNATMHVENKHTVEEAENIFVAVKSFMKKLASRCDEDGNPKV